MKHKSHIDDTSKLKVQPNKKARNYNSSNGSSIHPTTGRENEYKPKDMLIKKPLTIAMVLDSFDNSKNGAVTSTIRLSNLLRNRGHTVNYITTGKPGEHKILLPEWKLPIGKKAIQRMKVPLAKPEKKKLLAALAQSDIIHVHFPFWLGMNTVKHAGKLGKPVVSTFHIQAEHVTKNMHINSPFLIRMIYKYFVGKIYNPSDAVVSPSQFAEDELKAFGLTTPSVVISNGIPSEYRKIPTPKPKNYEDKFVILSVGRLAPEKQQDVIIDAITKSKYEKKIQLILLGEGPNEEKLHELGKRLTHFPEFNCLPAKALIPYYNIADLYVHAAEVEVECMSAMEAMACGCTLLISNSKKSATKQFALDSRSLFETGNSADLAKKIDYWIENENELKEANKSYVEFSKNYAISRSVDKLEELYYQLINGTFKPA